MPLIDALLGEFDHEVASTRRLLDILPEDRAAWKPHPKSMGLGDLARHIVSIPGWIEGTLTRDELDLNPPGGPAWVPPRYTSQADLLATWDDAVTKGRGLIGAASEAQLFTPWSLKSGGQVIFTLPRAGVLRSFIFSHLIHHRGQLTVYLRMCDVALPSVYGPTADVPM